MGRLKAEHGQSQLQLLCAHPGWPDALRRASVPVPNQDAVMTSPATPPKPVTPVPAATVLLLRDSAAGPEVFMVVRHGEIDFASGALVFPGGRVDDDDSLIADRVETYPHDDGLDIYARALRVAAIRETFEECGVLLARARGESRVVEAARYLQIEANHRIDLHSHGKPFHEVLEAEQLALAPDLLVPYAHWITPVTQRRRYDTHFYLAAAPTDQVAVHDGGEAVDSIWITAADALDGQAAGKYKLVFPTFLNLTKLSRYASVAEAIEVTRRTKIVTVQPELVEQGEGHKRRMRLPIEADYGGDIFEVNLPSS